MNKLQRIKPIISIAAGALLATAGFFLFYHFQGDTGAAKAATPVVKSRYTTEWKATKLLSIYTGNLPIKYSNTSSRKWMAIGAAEWTADYYSGVGAGKTLVAHETWVSPTPNCYPTDTVCKPGGANAGAYLYGIASENQMTPYKNMTFDKKNWDDPLLYDVSSVNPRFQGPGAVGQTNSGSNIEGFVSTGAYGWWAGDISDCEGCRYRFTAAGTMIPLKWTVTGEIYE